MLFPTITFALFFAVVLPVSWGLMGRPRAWRLWMLAANAVFYGWWDWRFLALIGGSTVANQLLAARIHRAAGERGRRGWLAAAVIANLGLLGFFKYYGFFVVSGENLLRSLGLEPHPPLLDVALPVGISFFTFKAISYVVEVYRRQLSPAPFAQFAVYLSMFPQLLAGPIDRASETLPQLATPRDPHHVEGARAFRLILGGLFKKIVIADTLARALVDPVFAQPGDHGAVEAALAIYGYAVQIYCDFSAYSDIAIGVALLLGFRLPRNFDAPYAATSLREFWRRWHITLSRWLRDFLYVPLGGNRRGPARTYVNLMLTMLLGGLWHGAMWKFVLWGGLHGGGLAVERWLRDRLIGDDDRPLHPGLAARTVRRAAVFHFVCLAWVFFRATSMVNAGEVLAALTRWTAGLPDVPPVAVLVLAGGLALQFVPRPWLPRADAALARLSPAVQAACLALGLTLVDALGPEGVMAFIYFQF